MIQALINASVEQLKLIKVMAVLIKPLADKGRLGENIIDTVRL